MAEALREQQQKRQEWVNTLTRIRRDLDQTETQKGRILTAYRKGFASEMDLEQQLTTLKAETQHLQHVAEEMEKRLRFTVDLDTAVATIRRQIQTFRAALHKKTVPFSLKRKIVETFVSEVIVTLEQGSGLHVTMKQTIPFRPQLVRSTGNEKRETVWKRTEESSRKQGTTDGNVQILYRFPFPPQPQALVSITSPMGVSTEFTPTPPPCCGSDSITKAWEKSSP